jgi:cyanophycinase
VSRGPLALVGSGEYLPVMTGVEGMLLDGRPPRYVQIPTAAAPEGEQVLKYWLDLGAAQAERLNVEQVPVMVHDRQDADDAGLAARIAGAGLIYLSGGNPLYLAQTLRGTRVWQAIAAAWQAGSALAGCSAGAIAVTSWVPRSFRGPPTRSPDPAPGPEPDPGLGLLPQLRVLPHFDKMIAWVPDLMARATAALPEGITAVGIDEDTAMVDMTGAGHTWQVHGRQQVWLLGEEKRQGYPAGATLTTPPAARLTRPTRADWPHP